MFLITDTRVFTFYGQEILKQLKTFLPCITCMTLNEGEGTKSFENAQLCWQKMIKSGGDRHSLVISLGGGVISDLAGFVAGCYMRGVDIIHIPTTLMGMIDAAIGGKTGVNLPEGKNLIGVIHQPEQVFINPHFLETLPDRDYRAGLAEMVKYAIIEGPCFFEVLETHAEAIIKRDFTVLKTLIEKCCRLKADIVEQDPYDQNLRLCLNLGHTFAHALETATCFSSLHGEAVAIGLSCAFYCSWKMGFIEKALLIRLHNLLEKFKLPCSLPSTLNPKDLTHLLSRDKKTVGKKIHLILIREMGKVEKIPVDLQWILQALNSKMVDCNLE